MDYHLTVVTGFVCFDSLESYASRSLLLAGSPKLDRSKGRSQTKSSLLEGKENPRKNQGKSRGPKVAAPPLE